jgi:DnaJ family protein C protein 13
MRSLWESGVLTVKTKCWAQGMDGWRMVQQVSQLKWCFVAKGTPVMNESELATLILNILIQMCQYFPSRLVS